jgi:hypothetical protein
MPTEPNASWVESVQKPESGPNLFFTLSADKLAEALESALPKEPELSDQQKLYAHALLLSVASVSVGIMAEQARLDNHDTMPTRLNAPASSLRKSGEYEAKLYALIDKAATDADIAAIRSIVKPQTITATAHPNFSRSKDLIDISTKLIVALGNMDGTTQKLAESNTLPESISSIVSDLSKKLTPRTKRNRQEELGETTLDLIPKAMAAASEQVKIFKQRKALATEVAPRSETLRNKKIVSRTPIEREVTVKGKTVIAKGFDTEYDDTKQSTLQQSEFTSTKQLEAVAELLPQYNSWFLDGDGKRTCHAYDAELAVPAIKRATYEQYKKILDTLPDNALGNFDAAHWKLELGRSIATLKEVEKLAAKRMNALNELHEAHAELQNNTYDKDARTVYNKALKTAQDASQEYKHKLTVTVGSKGTRIGDMLREDETAELKKQLGAALDDVYDSKVEVAKTHKETAEDLYVKLAAYGNYAVHLQRRENALQYKEVFEYLIQNNFNELKETLAATWHIPKDQVEANLKKPEHFSQAVELMALSAMRADDPLHIGSHMQKIYKRLAGKLEKSLTPSEEPVNPALNASLIAQLPDTIQATLKGWSDALAGKKKTDDEYIIEPLQAREFLTLDALGSFNMAKMYPEAFKGGFIIAEFAQPDIDILQNGDEQAKRDEVIRLAKTDMMMNIAFAHSMGADNVSITPLHEDPATMRYIPEAQAALREAGPIRDYMLNYIGTQTPGEASKKAVHYLNDEGQPERLTAYQNLKRYGATDEELAEKGLDVEQLKHTFVLLGPKDMEACSDNNKRSSSMGSIEAEQSIREKAIQASKNPVEIDGEQYVIVKPKYLGQGGALARATDVPIDTVEATWQGEHLHNLVPKSIAQKSYNNLLGRLFIDQKAAAGETITADPVTTGVPMHFGNRQGLTGHGLDEGQRGLLDKVVAARIASTRDDKRYNDFLKKYGEPALNYSARPNAKSGGNKVSFNEGRAIGIAAMEAGMFSNIIAVAHAFWKEDPASKHKGEITTRSGEDIKEWNDKDPAMQQVLTSAALTATFVNMQEKWLRGDIDYHKDPKTGGTTLTKAATTTDENGDKKEVSATVNLDTLITAYKNPKQTEYVDKATGIVFDAGDLVMAHHNDQFNTLEKGLRAAYKTSEDPLNMFNKEQRSTILKYKNTYDQTLTMLRTTKDRAASLTKQKTEGRIKLNGEEEKFLEDRKLTEGVYYLLHESGTVYPLPDLVEKDLYKTVQENYPRTETKTEESLGQKGRG